MSMPVTVRKPVVCVLREVAPTSAVSTLCSFKPRRYAEAEVTSLDGTCQTFSTCNMYVYI